MSYEWLFFCVLFIGQIPAVLCQFEICIFHGLDADCRYKIDARTISHMTAKIDQCDHPISLAFNIHNDVLGIDFSHTFDGPDTLIMVHGFDVETKLRVRLNRKDDDILNVEVDFYVYGLRDADFINQDIELIGLTEGCFTLNEAGKIAVGVTGGLVFIVIVMVIILLFIRRSRRKQEAQRYRNGGFAGGGTMEMNSRAP